MTASAGRSRRQRCVTCTPSEWRAIKAKARAEGVDVSAYILARVLDGEAPDGPPHLEAGYPMALTGAEQRRQLEIVGRFVAGCGPLMQAPLIKGHGMTIGQAFSFVTLSLDAGGSLPEERSHEDHRARPDPEPAPGPLALPEPNPRPEPETRTANASDAGQPADARPRQADLFDNLGAAPPSGDGARAREFLDDVVDELNRDGES